MKKIEKPIIDYKQEIIDLNKLRKIESRQRVTDSIDKLISLSNEFNSNFSSGDFTIPSDYSGLVVTKGDMLKLYENHLVNSHYYSEIKREGIKCPICELRNVEELDHYCEKSVYYPFSIYPNNLIPLCHNCNHTKLDFNAKKEGFRLFNAYYDDFDLLENLIIKADFSTGVYDPKTTIINAYSKDKYDLIISNFEKFGLFNEYNEEALNDFNLLLYDLLSYPNIMSTFSLVYFRGIILNRYSFQKNTFANSYKTAFYRGILENISDAYDYVSGWLLSKCL